jgi:hypothetical protein
VFRVPIGLERRLDRGLVRGCTPGRLLYRSAAPRALDIEVASVYGTYYPCMAPTMYGTYYRFSLNSVCDIALQGRCARKPCP